MSDAEMDSQKGTWVDAASAVKATEPEGKALDFIVVFCLVDHGYK